MSKEVIEKRRQTMLRKYASGEIVSYLKGKPAWNKGIPMSEAWKQNLRKPKTKTEKLVESVKQKSEKARKKNPKVLVYDHSGKYINSFRSVSDLSDYSKTDKNDLPTILRNKVGRNNLSPKALKNQNIILCCNGTSKHYKGLQFRFENSELPVLNLSVDEILTHKCRATKKLVDDTLGELRENLVADNPQPS